MALQLTNSGNAIKVVDTVNLIPMFLNKASIGKVLGNQTQRKGGGDAGGAPKRPVANLVHIQQEVGTFSFDTADVDPATHPAWTADQAGVIAAVNEIAGWL